MYSYLKCIVYDKLLKPRESFRITLYNFPLYKGVFTDISSSCCEKRAEFRISELNSRRHLYQIRS